MSEVYRTRSTPGRRYGGSSRVNAVGWPFRTVRESAQETISVKNTPTSTTPTTVPAAANEATAGGTDAATKTVASMMSVGNRPLQGTKLLVRIAISRSRGESMILVEMIPAALQPNPMAMESDCLPCAPARRKSQSRLNATRGR